MTAETDERRTLLLMALMALWLATYGFSVLLLVTTKPAASAALPDMNRIVGFLGWQGIAGMIAFACWGVGWSFPKGAGIRRISAVPLVMALALIVVMVGMAVFSN